MKENRKHINSISIECALAIVFSLSVLLWITWYKFKYGIAIIESDSASDIYYAHLLANEGTLISSDWYFSTAVRFADSEWVFALLFQIFPSMSWWHVELLGTAVMNTLMGLAGILAAYSYGLGRHSIWAFGLMLLPYGFSEIYYVLFHGAGYYSSAVIEVLVLLSLFSLVQRNIKSKCKYILLFTYLIVSFTSGCQGIRLIECLFVPMLITSVYRFISSKKTGSPIHFAEFKLTVYGVAASFIGYLFNVVFLSRNCFLNSQLNYSWKNFSFEPIEQLINELLSNAGYIGADVFSIKSIANVGALGLLIFAGYVIVTDIKNNDRIFLLDYLISASILHAIIYLFIFNEYKARYALPFLSVLIIIMLKFIADRKKNVYVFVISALLLMTTPVNLYHVKLNHQGINNYSLLEMADCLEENGYRYGFSTFWYANVTNELSNGNIHVCTINDFNSLTERNWLQTANSIDTAYSGPVFLIVPVSEASAISEQDVTIIYEDDTILAYGFDSIDLLNQFLCQLAI